MKKIRDKKSTLFTIILLASLFTSLNTPKLVKTQTPETIMHIDPPSLTAQLNDNIRINVCISNAADVCSWEFKLFYRNSILSGTKIIEGPFLKSGGSTFFWVQSFTDNYNATHGIIWAACTGVWSGPGVNGSGVLATITFKAIGGGNNKPTPNRHNTGKLSSPKNTPHNPRRPSRSSRRRHSNNKCYPNKIYNRPRVSSRYKRHNRKSRSNNRNIQHNAICKYNTNRNKRNNPPRGASTTLTFTWNTTDFTKGNYTIWAYAWPVFGETYTEDNTLVNGWVLVTIPGDVVVPYFEVDIYDVAAICMCYDQKIGDPLYVPNYDINSDGIIDIYDVATVCVTYGEKDP